MREINVEKLQAKLRVLILDFSNAFLGRHWGFPGESGGEEYACNSGAAAAAAQSLQSCSTLCDPIDHSPQGSSLPAILQARILEWVAISFSNA